MKAFMAWGRGGGSRLPDGTWSGRSTPPLPVAVIGPGRSVASRPAGGTYSRARRGALLHEALMAIALALVVVAGVAQLLTRVAQQRRMQQQRATAIREVGNLMEELVARPWSELAGERVPAVTLSESCRRDLPDAELRLNVVGEDETSQRIHVRLDWRLVSGRRSEPVRLVGWRFRDEEDEEAGP